MKKLVLILLLIWAKVPVFSQSTCRELYQEIKESDCGSKVFKWLEGSYLEFGLSLSVAEVDLDRLEDEKRLGSQNSSLNPFPAISLSFPNNYFGQTSFAWAVSIGYMYNMGLEQTIQREDESRSVDLHTYFSMANISANPSIFYVFGREDREDWPYWAKLGLGIGLGVGRVRGTAYLTEDDSDQACYDAGTRYVDKEFAAADVRNACAILSYNEIGLGVSAAILIEFRVKSFILSIESAALNLRSRLYDFVSAQVSYSLTYAIAL